MSVDYSVIGKRIKLRRKARKKTQDNLAEALSVSVGYISQIERGVTKVNLDTLSEIASFLDCDLSEFLTGVMPSQNSYLNQEIEKIAGKLREDQKSMLLEIANVIAKY